jgi:8-oxo-dGTP diphosphatase
MPEPRVGAATFVIKGTQILLGRSKKLNDQIVIPGGGLKWGEPLQQAARREIKEEAGIDILMGDVLFVSEIVTPEDHRIVIYLMGQYVQGEPVAGDDLSDVFWCDTRELAQYQDEMTDLTIDAIYKFSIAVKSRGMTTRVN